MTYNPLNIAALVGVQLHTQNVPARANNVLAHSVGGRASEPPETLTLCNTLHDSVISALALRAVPVQAHIIRNKFASISRFHGMTMVRHSVNYALSLPFREC